MKTTKDLSIKLDNGGKIDISGRIDRLDICETDDSVLVKVVDYKSSDKKFDYTDVYYGLSLQLLVYMKAALAIENANANGKKCIPAAILYNSLKDPLIDGNKNGNIDKNVDTDMLILDEMKPNGVLYKDLEIVKHLDKNIGEKPSVAPFSLKSDGDFDARSDVLPPEVMEYLPEFAIEKIKEAATEISKGNIKMNPYKKGDDTPCRYCDYASICNFDVAEEEFGYRYLKKLDRDTFVDKIIGGETNA